jgi:FKBP-type peptidyl-prolyl cis-trans isomerase FkpA
MKRFFVCCVLAGFVAAGTACAADPELKTDDDKTFYALGLVLANQLGPFRMTPAELELVKAGLTDGTLKKKTLVEVEAFGPKIKPLADARQASGAAEEKKKGKAYLETIAAKPGIKKTGSGLLMETVTEGTGKSPVANDKIKVNYKGMLIDGKVFDESAKHGGPQTMALGAGLMKCWNEALEFMKVGGKAKLYCPAELAYGDRPNGEIPAGATLVFDVELLEIVKPEPVPAPAPAPAK